MGAKHAGESKRGRRPTPATRWSIVAAAVGLAMDAAPVMAGEIHEAAEFGNIQKVKACLERDPNAIRTTDARGRSVLDRAALSGKLELVELLLERGAPEDIVASVIVGHTEKVTALLKREPKAANNLYGGEKGLLHWAALYGRRPVVDLLLAEKAEINGLDGDGFTALHWATMFNRREVVDALLAGKADTSIKVAKYGWTPLRLAVIHGHLESAESLMNGGADPNLKDEDNIPLLHQAVITGKKAMVELLIARRANVNAKDSDGDTPLDEAVETGKKEIAEVLRRNGAKHK